MTEAEFWTLIAETKGNADAVQRRLEQLGVGGIRAYNEIYGERYRALHTWELWGAAYVARGGCSDDSFDYFKSWVIGRGETAYRVALADPDGIAEFITPADIDAGLENEMLDYVADKAYERVRSPSDPPKLDFTSRRSEDPSGAEWDEDTVDELYPRMRKVAQSSWAASPPPPTGIEEDRPGCLPGWLRPK